MNLANAVADAGRRKVNCAKFSANGVGTVPGLAASRLHMAPPFVAKEVGLLDEAGVGASQSAEMLCFRVGGGGRS